MSDESNNNVIKNIFSKVILKINCSYCGNRFKKNINYKEESNEYDDNQISSTSIGTLKNFINKNSSYLNKFELEFLPYGDIAKKKGRKKWTENHDIVLKSCLRLFGKNLNMIKKFIPKFSENILLKKIDSYENTKLKNIFISNNKINYNENNLNEMIESFGELEIDSINKKKNNNDFLKEFSIDHFIEINKLNKKNNQNNFLYKQNSDKNINNFNYESNKEDLLLNKFNFNIQNDFEDEKLENEINNIFNENIEINKKFSIDDVINNSINSLQFN